MVECFLSSAATAADPAVRPAPERRDGFSGEVTERSKAAGMLQSHFEAKMSAGEPGEVSSPSHHLMAIWCSLGSRLRPRPGGGTAESHAEVWGKNTDRRRALSAGELSCKKRVKLSRL